MNKVKRNKIQLFTFLLLTVSLVSLFLFSKRDSYSKEYDRNNLSSLLKKTQSEIETGYKVQVSVLNGCGVKGIADLYTNFLRNMGYDVIDYGNAKHFEYSKTKLLVHNKNHKDFIYEVVELLEINPEHMEYNYDKNIFYDLTLIIGSDYTNLDSFSEVSLHYEPF